MNVPVPPFHVYVPFDDEPDNVKSFVAQIVPPRPATEVGASTVLTVTNILAELSSGQPIILTCRLK